MRSTVVLYAASARLAKLVREALHPVKVTIKTSPGRADWYPTRPQAVVTAGSLTNGGLRAYAMLLGVETVVLPEGGPWLAQKVQQGAVSVLAGFPVGKNAVFK